MRWSYKHPRLQDGAAANACQRLDVAAAGTEADRVCERWNCSLEKKAPVWCYVETSLRCPQPPRPSRSFFVFVAA